jgi:hypothetical protein
MVKDFEVSAIHNIVQKLWSLCNILKDEGITYHQYVTELTLLTFLKMVKKAETEHRVPNGSRWSDFQALNGIQQHNHYRKMLLALGKPSNLLVASIYANASTNIKEPRHLAQLIAEPCPTCQSVPWRIIFSNPNDESAKLFSLTSMLSPLLR